MNEQRTERERDAYNDGGVDKAHGMLRWRYWHVFRCPNTISVESHFHSAIAQRAPGASALDYGCYFGDLTQEMLQFKPASVTGIDISDRALDVARERFGDAAEFRAMDGAKMDFADNSFDLIAGRAVLHHLNWNAALAEINRVLKPGGTAAFIEPLGDNPAGKFLRWITADAHTADERPLSRRQIVQANQLLGTSDHRFGNLASVPIGLLTSRISKNPFNRPLRWAHHIDTTLAKTPMKYWMRFASLVWRKPE